MTFRVRSAFADGVPRIFRRSSWILIGAYLLVTVLQDGLIGMISTAVLPLGDSTALISARQMLTPGTQLPPIVAFLSFAIALFTGTLLTSPVLVVANRTLVSQFTDRIPEEFVLHRLGWATINSFLASLVILVSIGMITVALFGLTGWGLITIADQTLLGQLSGTSLGQALLIGTSFVLLLPGAFLGVSLTFVGQEIAVKDKNVIEALVGSWRLAQYNRLRLFVLVLGMFVAQISFSFASEFLQLISIQIISVVGGVFFQIGWLSIMARVYVQLHNRDEIAPLVTDQDGLEQRHKLS